MAQANLPLIVDDIYAYYGRQLLNTVTNNEPIYTLPPPIIASLLPHDAVQISESADSAQEWPVVGILGAGVGGLYTALILLDLGIPFKVIEARDRVGGRLYTYTFPNPTGGPYNYYDVGAMRFPKIDIMKRLFKLFSYPPLNSNGLALDAKLKPYVKSYDDNLESYNGVTVRKGDAKTSETFKASEVLQDVIGDAKVAYLAIGADRLFQDAITPFATELKSRSEAGWAKLMGVDKHSVRSYLCLEYRPSKELLEQYHGLPDSSLSNDLVNWIETMTNSTGSFDRAFAEAVLEELAFASAPSQSDENPWHCIDGGSFQIANTMYQYLNREKSNVFSFSKRVTALGETKNANGDTVIDITTDGHEQHRFPFVISSIPLPVLRTVDLAEAGLSTMQHNALRELNYGPSVKIGMQFRTAWWSTGLDKDGKPLNIKWGESSCDSPIRTVVYPSYGPGKTTSLIASYTWTEDAERLAAMVANEKHVLVDLVLRELAKLHNLEIAFLRNQLIDTFPWSWSQDPYTMGAFAFFGPGKFINAYKSLTSPAARGHLHFAGEALSVRHAWVEGALDSAWRAVHSLLLEEPFRGPDPESSPLLKKFFTNWGVNAEWFAPRASMRGGEDSKEDSDEVPSESPTEEPASADFFELPVKDGEVDVGVLLGESFMLGRLAARTS